MGVSGGRSAPSIWEMSAKGRMALALPLSPSYLPPSYLCFLASPPTSSARPCIALTPIRAQRCRPLACRVAGRRASKLTVHFHLDRALAVGVRLPLQMKQRATCPLLPSLVSPPRVDRTHRGVGPRARR